MSDLNKLVRATLKRYGEQAPERFGVKKVTLDGYVKRGKFPLKLIEAILHDNPVGVEAPPQPAPPPPPPPTQAAPPQQPATFTSGSSFPPVGEQSVISGRVDQIVKYIQGTVDFYIKQFSERITLLEKEIGVVRANQMRAAIGVASLARPDQYAPVDQTFTTNPLGNSLDTGVAPTKEQVDAQANMAIIEGVPVPGAQLARPAEFLVNQPSFGFGWNQPRAHK
jgi:hypothetical protein